MGLLVFHVFQVLKIRRLLEQMKEIDIVKAIMKYLRTVPGCFCWKEHGGMYGTAGIPDIIACIDGHFFGFEVKTDIGKPTKLQEAKAVCGVAQAMQLTMDSDLNYSLNGISGAVVGGSPGGTVNNYYNNDNSRTVNQTNNSPKALSRLEIYRQTRNALNV